MRALSALRDPLRAPLLVLVGSLVAFRASLSWGKGDSKLAELVVAGAWSAVVLVRPRLVCFALLVLGASVLPYGSLGITVGGHATDVVEVTIFLLVGAWVLTSATGDTRHRRTPFAPFVGVLLLAVAVGTVVGLGRGSTGHDVFGYMKPWAYYALALPLATWFASEEQRRRLHLFVVALCVVGSLLVLLVVATGTSVPFVGTRPLGVGTLGVTEAGIERIRPDLVALLVLATLLVAGEVAVKGASPARIGVLALFFVMHVLSFTRSTWAPLGLCLLALVALHPGRRRRLRGLKQGLVVAGVSATLLLVASAGTFGHTGTAAVHRLESVFEPKVLQEASYTDREDENHAAWQALGRHPLTGVGIAQTYGATVVVYLPDPPRLVYLPRTFIHDQYLYAWLQLGVLGLVAFGLLAWATAWCVARAKQEPTPEQAVSRLAAALALVVYLLQFVLQTNILYPANILAMVTAMTLAAPLAAGPRPADDRPGPSRTA